MKRLCFPLAIALVMVVLAACLGTGARNHVLMPPAKMAWPEVRVDFEHGVTDGLLDGDLTQIEADRLTGEADKLGVALEAGDRLALFNVMYTSDIKPWASRGISAALEAGEIGPNGALLLTERLANFSAAILVLQERTHSLIPISK